MYLSGPSVIKVAHVCARVRVEGITHAQVNYHEVMIHFMFITLVPSYASPVNSYVTIVYIKPEYYICLYILVCLILVCTRIHWTMFNTPISYVIRMYSNVSRMYSYLIGSTPVASCGVLVTIRKWW